MTDFVSAVHTAILGRDDRLDPFKRGSAFDGIKYFAIRHAASAHAILLGLGVGPEELTEEPFGNA
jgi:hypothetical protein